MVEIKHEQNLTPVEEPQKAESLPTTAPESQELKEKNTPETAVETAPAVSETKPPSKFHLPLLRKHVKPIPQVRDEMTLRMEKILEERLQDSYARLPPLAKQEFKLKGEMTAVKIRELLNSTRAQAKKIFRLIFEWLKMLPGINRFFLEQEAKIKTDKIIELKNRGY